MCKELDKERDRLTKKQNKLYEELTDTFIGDSQYNLLSELIETELALERFCNV